ncbi:MAG: Helix-turn-helix domain [Bacillus sp. (in: firmicutes)]|jgi:transcriptional regulator with XRE-family HTH domain|nr:Helix-turn-helix domain [Bacillus sp. (in: firmicutes)]
MEYIVEKRLKEVMDERGLKQSHFVKKFGINPSTMSALYRGESVPTYPYSVIISREIGLPAEEIWPVTVKQK